MTLKFDLHPDGQGYILAVFANETETRVQATENELRRLLIDLQHEFGAEIEHNEEDQ